MNTRVVQLGAIKHRAPNGALRRGKRGFEGRLIFWVIKHRAPNGALRRSRGRILTVDHEGGDKAPSAKRCIKTARSGTSCTLCGIRAIKHRAPNGALRPQGDAPVCQGLCTVIKHRAPQGTLRHGLITVAQFILWVISEHRAP